MMGVISEREDALVDQLLEQARHHGAAALLNLSGVTVRLMKALAECMLDAELKHHLLRPSTREAAHDGNYRNGSTPKTVATPVGKVELAVPRVRHATFAPRLLPRYKRSIPGFGLGILALYGRGLPLRELRSCLQALYDEPAWAELGDTLTCDMLLHVRDWQMRRLEPACALVYFGVLPAADAPMCFALGLLADGGREVLGFWRGNTMGIAVWRDAMRELRERGLTAPAGIAGHILPGLREAAALAYPAAPFIKVQQAPTAKRRYLAGAGPRACQQGNGAELR
jgi:transposase-like protein